MKTMLILMMSICTILGCKENNASMTIDGTYVGKFIYGTPGSMISADSQVTFSGNNYNSTLGSGTYEVMNNNTVRFKDVNIWTANFDWNTILNRDYIYELKGDSLIMTKPSNAAVMYQYRLKLQN
ncbi:hypothetical protein [Pedobacter immunditicola]|uniref:hypothetical protein n=1 Tax=Pedobacter immunditicola TaxID=3133440 RepID=UPI0030B762F9